MTLLAHGLSVAYDEHVAVERCDLEFAPGGLIGLLGPNGAGKTSLLRALAGLITRQGTVSWCGEDMTAIGRSRRARTLAYLPQSASSPWPLPVRDLVALGRLPHLRFGEGMRAADHAAVERAIEAANVGTLADRRVDTLSGGETMRAHIARVLAVEAPVLLVDEPVANLDPSHQLLVMELLAAHASAGRCIVAVMHDLTLAARYCHRVVLMQEGKIAGDGHAAEILTESTLNAVYGVSAVVEQRDGHALVVPWRRLTTCG